MSRNTKIILMIVGCLAVIRIGACVLSAFLLPRFAQRAFSTSPSDAHRIGTFIAQYTLPLTIYETQSASGRLRQAVGGFSGKNGYVMVMAMGESNQWSEDLMKTFFGSIQ